MALSEGLTFAVIRSLHERPLEAKRLTTILEAQDERVPRETPRHPVRNLQGALEESLVENADPRKARWPAMPSAMVDSATRRRLLLQHLDSDAAYTTRWRQRPDERHHPLTKLVAQISYGIHLLHKGMVSSDAEVIRILQTYVAEVDNFLEQTTEDFDLALCDIEERIKCLRLPLEHDEIFDSMLEDRVFRKQIVDGNEKIEHIINRTETAMNDALDDVQAGLEATKELAKYLVRLDRKWAPRTEEQEDVYAAMSGNTEGWFRCFFSLQTKGQNLSMLTIQLGTVVAELQRRAGVASRKDVATLIAENRLAGEPPQAENLRGGAPQLAKALPEGPGPVPPPFQPDDVGRRSSESPVKSLSTLESLSPLFSTIEPRRPVGGAKDPGDSQSASAQGMLEGRQTSSRTSLRSPSGLGPRRAGSLRGSMDHGDDCTCSCGRHGPHRDTSSRRSSITTRVLSFRRRRPSIEIPSPTQTADSFVTAPAFINSRRPASPPGPDSAYSSGESIAGTSSLSAEPERMSSSTPTFTSDLYHSALPSSSRLRDGKAAAIMGTLQRSGSLRERELERDRESERERTRARHLEQTRKELELECDLAGYTIPPMDAWRPSTAPTAAAAPPPLFSRPKTSSSPYSNAHQHHHPPRAKSRATTSVFSRTTRRFTLKMNLNFFKGFRRK